LKLKGVKRIYSLQEVYLREDKKKKEVYLREDKPKIKKKVRVPDTIRRDRKIKVPAQPARVG